MAVTSIHRSRILFEDAYDSFTNNIVALLETKLHVDVTIIRIDTTIVDLAEFLKPFTAVVLGPGPGDPRNPNDVGLYNKFWQLRGGSLIPILGICLGFQNLAFSFGASIEQLPQPRHGIIRNVRADGTVESNPLEGMAKIVQYHSLSAKLDTEVARANLVPLAWDYESDNLSEDDTNYDQNPAAILMAVRHRRLPYLGVQFHPESICSTSDAQIFLVRWWQHVLRWLLQNGTKTSTIQELESSSKSKIQSSDDSGKRTEVVTATSCVYRASKPMSERGLNIPTICSKLNLQDDRVVLLDSEKHQRGMLGQMSIIGILDPSTIRFEYNTGSRYVHQISKGTSTAIDLLDGFNGRIFDFLKTFMRQHLLTDGSSQIPFWGGLIGCISYEGCLETIDVSSASSSTVNDLNESMPDISFVFVQRSIVISHITKEIIVQTIRPTDDDWLNSTTYMLSSTPPSSPSIEPCLLLESQISLPNKDSYRSAFRSCKHQIQAGESYELCLTTRATITTSPLSDPLPLYMRLRQLNPAPFAGYYHSGGLTLLSSSPERFLKWSRPRSSSESDHLWSTCQFRPVKGTVKRRPSNGPEVTLSEARDRLAVPKEKAENLMIVDLIRHDLHGVAGAANVGVPKLMVVEQYETVFQLVSEIEGNLRIPKSFFNGLLETAFNEADGVGGGHRGKSASPPKVKTGIDVLAASLPPGSMTGAPKLRSCQILQELEARPRGIYSGVFGYLDVGGGGDFSVVIRSAYKWDGKCKDSIPIYTDGQGGERDLWTIGAGGAITALSTEEGEYEEMEAKLNSTLCLFHDETTPYSEQS